MNPSRAPARASSDPSPPAEAGHRAAPAPASNPTPGSEPLASAVWRHSLGIALAGTIPAGILLLAQLSALDPVGSPARTRGLVLIGGAALLSGLVFVLAYRRSRRLAQRVVGPLHTLTAVTTGTTGYDRTRRPELREIEALWDGVHGMLAASDAHHAQIEALNEDLEDEVQREVRKNRDKDHLILEQSRLASLGEMVASVAHQWRQPLGSLQFLVDDLRLNASERAPEAVDPEELREYIEETQQLIQHMSDTVDDFRAIYRNTQPEDRIRLHTVVDQALAVTDGMLKSAGITVEFDNRAPEATIEGRSNELCHVVLNLVSNARDVLLERRVREPRVWIRLEQDGDRHTIEVEDNAGGIDAAVASELFEPFVTGRKDGTGLGLYMSRRLVVERFSGTLEARNGRSGACFHIMLPAPAAAAPAP